MLPGPRQVRPLGLNSYGTVPKCMDISFLQSLAQISNYLAFIVIHDEKLTTVPSMGFILPKTPSSQVSPKIVGCGGGGYLQNTTFAKEMNIKTTLNTS